MQLLIRNARVIDPSSAFDAVADLRGEFARRNKNQRARMSAGGGTDRKSTRLNSSH